MKQQKGNVDVQQISKQPIKRWKQKPLTNQEYNGQLKGKVGIAHQLHKDKDTPTIKYFVS
jgi:hypothetical protein